MFIINHSDMSTILILHFMLCPGFQLKRFSLLLALMMDERTFYLLSVTLISVLLCTFVLYGFD